MRIDQRISRLEERTQVGRDKEGHCRHCHGREQELGGKVVVRKERDDPFEGTRLEYTRPDPGPTLCPACGRDLNTYIVVRYVDMIAKRRAEGG